MRTTGSSNNLKANFVLLTCAWLRIWRATGSKPIVGDVFEALIDEIEKERLGANGACDPEPIVRGFLPNDGELSNAANVREHRLCVEG